MGGPGELRKKTLNRVLRSRFLGCNTALRLQFLRPQEIKLPGCKQGAKGVWTMKKSLGAMVIAVLVACTVGAVPPSWGDDSGARGMKQKTLDNEIKVH